MAKRGDISEEQFAELLTACAANGSDLLEDARLLFANKRFPRAYVLGQLAGEEFTKALLVLSFGLMRASGIQPPMELFWSWWADHDEKGSFQKSWTDMIARLNASNWMELSLEPVRQLIFASLSGMQADWSTAQAHAKSSSVWREDATYVDFRNSKVLVPRGRIGRGRAKLKIDQVAAFGELVIGAVVPAPQLASIEETGVPAFMAELVQHLAMAEPRQGTQGSEDESERSAGEYPP